ncbi:Uncharacterized protein PKNOH_S09546400, partial [Plasmodium knowlesi]
MFRSIIPTTVGLNNSKYVHANIDEEYDLSGSNDNAVRERNKIIDEVTSSKRILSASNSYNIQIDHLENCKTPEEIALKILKSQNFQNKRKYTHENHVLCEKKKQNKNAHINNERIIYSKNACPYGRYSSSSSLGRQTTQTSNVDNFSFYKDPPHGYMYNGGNYMYDRRFNRDVLPPRKSCNFHGFVDNSSRLCGTHRMQQRGFSNMHWCHKRCEEISSEPAILSSCNHIDQMVINEMDKMKLACKYQFSTFKKFDKIGMPPGRNNILSEPPLGLSRGMREACPGDTYAEEGDHDNAIDVEVVYDHLSTYNPPEDVATYEEPLKNPPSDHAQGEGKHMSKDPPDDTTNHLKCKDDKDSNSVSILGDTKEGDENVDPSQGEELVPDMPNQRSAKKEDGTISEWGEPTQVEQTEGTPNKVDKMDDMQIKEMEWKFVKLPRGECGKKLEEGIETGVKIGTEAEKEAIAEEDIDAEEERPQSDDPKEKVNRYIENDFEKNNQMMGTHDCNVSIHPRDNNTRWDQLEQHMDAFLSINSRDIHKNKKMKRIVTCLEGCLKNDKNMVYDEGRKVELVLEKISANVKEFLSKEICYRRGRKKDMALSVEEERKEESIHGEESGTYSNVENEQGTEEERDEFSQSGSDNTQNQADEADETVPQRESAPRSRSKGGSKVCNKGCNKVCNKGCNKGCSKDATHSNPHYAPHNGEKQRGANNSRSAKQPNEAVMIDLIYGHYNILLYLILLNFQCFKKYLDTEELNEQVLINLKINFKNVVLTLCQCEIKNRIIQFYHVHESYLVQLNWLYEKCLLYISDFYIYIEEYDTILVNLLDLCTLTLQTNYNVQNIIVKSCNLLLRLFRNKNRKKMKKYVLDEILSNINNINFRYNKLNFRNSHVNSTYIHLITFLLLKIADSFSHYEGDLKRKYFLDHQREGGIEVAVTKRKIHKNFHSETDNNDEDGDDSDVEVDCNNDEDDDDEYYPGKGPKEARNRSRRNARRMESDGQSDQSRSLSIFTSEDEGNSICSGEPPKSSEPKRERKKRITGNSKGAKNNVEKKINLIKNTYSGGEEGPSEESLNQYIMSKNFKRLNSVVNYILIEIIEKTLYQDNKNAKTILQSLFLDLIKCCDNPLFSISTLFVKNSIHIFFDIINNRHEGNIKETCLFILRYILKYTFNIYNYVNDSCFHLLYNLNQELCQNKFIKPFFQLDHFKEVKEDLSPSVCITGGNISRGKKKIVKGKRKKQQKQDVPCTNGGKDLPGEMIKLLRCCDEVQKKDQMLRCQQCESFYHKMCIYRDANKMKMQRNIPQEDITVDYNSLSQTGRDKQSKGEKKKSKYERLNDDATNHIENILHSSNVAEHYCDNCKVRNLIKAIIIREAQGNNTFLNSKFRKKKEKNKGFYCFEKFVNKLKAFVLYYYYIVAHLKCDKVIEGIDRNCNNVYSYILILHNDFFCVDGNQDEGIIKNVTKEKQKKKNKELPSMKGDISLNDEKSIRLEKFTQMLYHEYRHADRKDDESLDKCTSGHNFDIYINMVWRIQLYFSFYDYFFVALNQLFYILYENGNRNLRYYSISIINNIISDNYLYLKCKQTQNILMSCLTDNYPKVREYTLYIYYNFCKNFLEVEKLSIWFHFTGGITKLALSSAHSKDVQKEDNSIDVEKNTFEGRKILEAKKRFNHYHRKEPIDLNQYITDEIVDSIRRCSKDIKISIRIVSVKILKYILYFNVYAKRYSPEGAQTTSEEENHVGVQDRHESSPRNCIRDNLSIMNDLIERYVSTFDNETMKSAVLEIFIDIFFINIFTQAKQKMEKREDTPEVDFHSHEHSHERARERAHGEYANDQHDRGYASEESQSLGIEHDSTMHITIEKNIYTLFIHLLYVMKNKHNINIVSKMLSHMEKNVRVYDDRLDSVLRFLREDDQMGRSSGGYPRSGTNTGVPLGNSKPLAKNGYKNGQKRGRNFPTQRNCWTGKGASTNHLIGKKNADVSMNDSSYKYLKILKKKEVKYILQVWIHNLICLFIKSRRNSSLEKETKKIINIFNIIIEIMPSLFIRYMDFFYPYIYNNDVSKDVCELLSSIIPHCKLDLNLKFQFKRVHFNNSLLYHQNIFISRSYVQLLCTLHTYIFSDFFYFKTYIEESLIKLHKYKLCFLINNYVVQLNDFVREFQFMSQEEKERVRGKLGRAYAQTSQININSAEEGDSPKGENHPDNFFIYNLIDIPYEEFVNHLDQYKKHIFDIFCVTHTDVQNLDKYAWLISVMMEFININKIVVNDVYSEGVDLNTHVWLGDVEEVNRAYVKGANGKNPPNGEKAGGSNQYTKKKQQKVHHEKSDHDNQTKSVKYIKLSDIAKRVQIYSQGILYLEFMFNKEVDYINKWNTLKLKNEIITEIIRKKINTKKIEKFVHICNYKFYDLSLIVVNLIVDLFYISNDIKYKCFFLLCLSKILSNFYNSHFINDLKLRDVFFFCINSFNPILQKNFLYTLLQLIKTYEQFLNNKDNLLLAQTMNKGKCENQVQGGKSNIFIPPSQQQDKNSKRGKINTKPQRGQNDHHRIYIQGDSKTTHTTSRNNPMGNYPTIEPTNEEDNLPFDILDEGDGSRKGDIKSFHFNNPNISNNHGQGKENHQKEKIKREAIVEEDDTNKPHRSSHAKGQKEPNKGINKEEENDNSISYEPGNTLLMSSEQLTGSPNRGNQDNGHNNDIIHVLLVASLFAQKIMDLLSVNRFIYTDCSAEELYLIKNLGIQILGNLYKEGFIQGMKMCPSIFCLCFTPDIKLKCRSEKIINSILDKESYNFVNSLAECLQHMLFYLIENHYMFSNFDNHVFDDQGKTRQMRDTSDFLTGGTLLFNKMEQPFFQCLLDIYDRLTNKNLKMKYVKTVLKEIENACHLVLYDKVRSFIRDVGSKYNASTGRGTHGEGTRTNCSSRNGCNVNVSVRIPHVKDIYALIMRKYMPHSGSSDQSDDTRDNSSDSSVPKGTKGTRSRTSNGENHIHLEEKKSSKPRSKPNHKRMNRIKRTKKEEDTSSCSNSKSSEKSIDGDISDIGTSSEHSIDERNIIEKIKKKYKYLVHHQMNVDEFTYINYFLFLYIQILTYLLSYLNFTTYNEMALLIHDINKVYYIISSTVNITSEVDSPKCNQSYFHSIDEQIQEISHEDEMNPERESENFSRVNLNLCKIKCFAMVLLNSLTNHLVRHYQVDTSRLNELIEDDSAKENKIEEEIREEKKNVFNYYEYIYECIEIFVEDNAIVMEKHAKHNLNMHNLGTHNLNNDYINGLMNVMLLGERNDGKNKKLAQKKKQREISRQRRLTL